MSDHPDLNGPASRGKLERLWVSLLDAFQTAMSAEKVPSTEMLGCVRLFTRDNGVKPTPGQVLLLQDLHTTLTGKLVSLLSSDDGPTGPQLETTRRFLCDNNISKDTALKVGLDQLQDLTVPFQ